MIAGHGARHKSPRTARFADPGSAIRRYVLGATGLAKLPLGRSKYVLLHAGRKLAFPKSAR
jgi:hypothetical protein